MVQSIESKNQPGNKMWNCVKPAQIAGIYVGYIQLTNTFACFWMICLLISTYCIKYWHGEFHGILGVQWIFHCRGWFPKITCLQIIEHLRFYLSFGRLMIYSSFWCFGMTFILYFTIFDIHTNRETMCFLLVNQLYV